MLDFSFKPEITKDYLLSKANQETYMSHYLGIPIKKGLFKNPLRSDNHVTCSFFTGKSGILYFKDFATGECLSFENVVMKKFNCSYHKALEIIAIDFGYIKGEKSSPLPIKIQPKFETENTTIIQIKNKEFSDLELNWWSSYGITPSILKKYKVYSCDMVFLHGTVYAQSTKKCPIYGYYFGEKEDIEQWRIYFPNRKETRFIGNVPTKIIQGYDQLPQFGKLLIITKSLKDCMSLNSIGLTAIAPNSETQFVSDDLLEDLKNRFKHIIVFYDNDLPGIINMRKIKKLHPELKFFFIPRKFGAKDFSDFYKKYGRENTIKVVKHYLNKFKNNEEKLG